MGDKWETSVKLYSPKCPEKETSVGNKCGRQVWETSVGDKCGRQEWETKVGDNSGRQKWETTVGDKCKLRQPKPPRAPRVGD